MASEDILNEFKQKIIEGAPDYDLQSAIDSDLQKWLAARDNNIEAAFEQFKNHLDFRKLHKLDDGFLENYKQPEVLKNYYPGGISGHCNDGYVVKYEMPGKLDVKGLLMSVSDEEFLYHAIFMAESLLKHVRDRMEETGQNLDKWTVVIDAEGFSIKQMTKSVLERQRVITKIFEDNYPDRLHCTYIVNCSRLFRLLLAIMKKTMDPSTFKKFEVLHSKDELAKFIPKSELPSRYGGSVKKDGLCDGGKIPEKYYQVERLLSSTKNWPRVEVKAGTEEYVQIEVTGESMYLAWEFFTMKNRITFSLYYQPDKESDNKRTLVISPYKPECCLCPETGSQDCQTQGTGVYTIVFNNALSKIKSKIVVYSIHLLTKDEIGNDEDQSTA